MANEIGFCRNPDFIERMFVTRFGLPPRCQFCIILQYVTVSMLEGLRGNRRLFVPDVILMIQQGSGRKLRRVILSQSSGLRTIW